MSAVLALATAFLAVGSVRGAAPALKLVFAPTKTVAQVRWDGWLDEVGVADVTGDGDPDIVGVKFFDGNRSETRPLVILGGDGKGAFKDVTQQVFVRAVPRMQHARRLIFADFNSDGRPDVFVADTGNDNPPFAGWPSTLVLSAPGGKPSECEREPSAASRLHALGHGRRRQWRRRGRHLRWQPLGGVGQRDDCSAGDPPR